MDIPSLIEAWFASHDDDGECIVGSEASCVAFSPGDVVGVLVYATKPTPALEALNQRTARGQIEVIAPSPGLPPAASVPWLSQVVGHRRLLFLGDMDPVDLMIFAWLRARLDAQEVTYLGVGDAYLRALNVTVPPSYLISCSAAEREATGELARLFPDYPEAIGANCSELLDRGLKIEIEAVVSLLGSPAALLQPALGDSDA